MHLAAQPEASYHRAQKNLAQEEEKKKKSDHYDVIFVKIQNFKK